VRRTRKPNGAAAQPHPAAGGGAKPRSAAQGCQNSGDTILISAAVPPVFLLGDVMRDAGDDHLGKARHGFSSPPPIRSSNQEAARGMVGNESLGSVR
jgi:hypothetical protein